jgi:mono/diheme cytochrome c family protein
MLRSKRLRPERAAGGKRREAAPASESAWGWGPTRSDKYRPNRLSLLAVLAMCLVAGGACRQDMHNQPKYRGLRPSEFFADGSSARPLVEGTVARGTLQEDEAFFTGKIDKATVKEFPIPIDEAVLNRGEERYNIYCSPCHDKTGGGNGMVIQRGFARQPPSYHIDRLRQADVGYFYDVITNGFGVMPDYRAQIAPRDRWAIVAYIRALQYSQHAPSSDVPGGDPTKVPQQPASGGEHAPGKN